MLILESMSYRLISCGINVLKIVIILFKFEFCALDNNM